MKDEQGRLAAQLHGGGHTIAGCAGIHLPAAGHTAREGNLGQARVGTASQNNVKYIKLHCGMRSQYNLSEGLSALARTQLSNVLRCWPHTLDLWKKCVGYFDFQLLVTLYSAWSDDIRSQHVDPFPCLPAVHAPLCAAQGAILRQQCRLLKHTAQYRLSQQKVQLTRVQASSKR